MEPLSARGRRAPLLLHFNSSCTTFVLCIGFGIGQSRLGVARVHAAMGRRGRTGDRVGVCAQVLFSTSYPSSMRHGPLVPIALGPPHCLPNLIQRSETVACFPLTLHSVNKLRISELQKETSNLEPTTLNFDQILLTIPRLDRRHSATECIFTILILS